MTPKAIKDLNRCKIRHQQLYFPIFPSSNKKLRSPPNYFIINLAVSDLLMVSTQSPMFFVNSLYKEWVFGKTGTIKTSSNRSDNLSYRKCFFLLNSQKEFLTGFSAWLCCLGCEIYAFCSALFGITSMINLVAISIDRYIVITKPLQAIGWNSKRRMLISILIVWIYSLAWSSAPLLGWSKCWQPFCVLLAHSVLLHAHICG